MEIILALLAMLIGLGIAETARHRFMRRRIPIRIHVNGSRGKSSVTRLVAAGLRAGGLRTLAKTTGSAAVIIHPDGSETPVQRRGGPNIREQLGVFRTAVATRAEALVLECMAVRPDLQRVCEHNIVRATMGVITNVRPDHLEVMGPTLDDVANSLSGTVPHGTHLLTAEDRFSGFLADRARRQGSRFTCTDGSAVDERELDDFPYIEFTENVDLALAVCEAAGVRRDTALAGMRQVRPDAGALTRRRLVDGDARIEFVNAFAANDPDSYLRVWRRLGLAGPAADSDRPRRIVLLMNIRADRQRRSKDLAPLFGRQLVADHYVLMGEETALFADLLKRQGLPAERITSAGADPERVWTRLLELAGPECLVVGVGNIGGAGNALLQLLRELEAAA